MGLFKPGWMSTDRDKAIEAIGKLKRKGKLDINTLYAIARNAALPEIRLFAQSQMNFKHELVLEMAMHDIDPRIRAMMVEKDCIRKAELTSLLAHEKDTAVQAKIQHKLNMITEKEEQERRAAEERKRRYEEYEERNRQCAAWIRSEFEKMTENERISALCSSDNGVLLGKKLDSYYQVLEETWPVLSQEGLLHIAMNAVNGSVRSMAEEGVTDFPVFLRLISFYQNKNDISTRLIGRLEGYPEQELSDAILKGCLPFDRSTARIIKKISSTSALERIAQDTTEWADCADIRLQEIKGNAICGTSHQWRKTGNVEEDLYNEDIRIERIEYRCERCGGYFRRSVWSNGMDTSEEIYYISRKKR